MSESQPNRPAFLVNEGEGFRQYVAPAEAPLSREERADLEEMRGRLRRGNARWLKEFRRKFGR